MTEPWSNDWPANLDWGIYWFGTGDEFEKAVAGTRSRFYDPARNTMIFFHGYNGGADSGLVQYCYRMTTHCDPYHCPDHRPIAEAWFEAGWNVGFFFWDQFADEDCARDAEQKIWFDRGGNGMRWRSKINGELQWNSYVAEGVGSITDLCVMAVKDAMPDYSGPHVRFVGHDLGAQLATRCAAQLHLEGHAASPARLALLDPYFTEHHLNLLRCDQIDLSGGLGSFAAEATAGYVRRLWEREVITEVYKSSAFSENWMVGQPNAVLDALVALIEYAPNWCGHFVWGWDCKHKAVVPMYFLAFGDPPPPLSVAGPDGQQPGVCLVPSSACMDSDVKELVSRQNVLTSNFSDQQRWVHEEGKQTLQTEDDTFRLIVSQETGLHLQPDHPPAEPSLWDWLRKIPFGTLFLFCVSMVGIILWYSGILGLAHRCVMSCCDEDEGDFETLPPPQSQSVRNVP